MGLCLCMLAALLVSDYGLNKFDVVREIVV